MRDPGTALRGLEQCSSPRGHARGDTRAFRVETEIVRMSVDFRGGVSEPQAFWFV